MYVTENSTGHSEIDLPGMYVLLLSVVYAVHMYVYCLSYDTDYTFRLYYRGDTEESTAS